MPEQPDDQLFSDGQPFTGAHPTNREFVEQLRAWGFTQRKEDGVHLVFRGPKGGTLRVIRSQLGRADPAVADKAARLAGVTPAQFWAGPQRQAAPGPPRDAASAGRAASRRKPAARDSVISLVLAIHAQADRPLGFDQVVERSGNRVTRAQVSTASSVLRRDGQLDRIRAGVYQCSGGQRAAARQIPTPRPSARPLPSQAPLARDPAGPSARQPGPVSAAVLFSQLYPDGVHVTGELFADLEQLLRLTGKLAAGGSGTAP